MSEPTNHRVREDVESTLRSVEDARTGTNVFEAGLIEAIEIEAEGGPASRNAGDSGDDGASGGDPGVAVTIEADLARFDPRTRTDVMETVLTAVRSVDGVEGAHVEPARRRSDDRVSIDAVDTVIAVASTKGGVGKTTVATQLACALAADRDVGLFDADIFGPNTPSLLGVDGPIVADDDGNPIPASVGGMELLSVGLMTDGGPLAWRGAMAHDALSDLFSDAAWDDPDVLVVDLPPGTSDVLLTTLQEVPLDGVVFVTTPFHTSVEDTRRSRRLFEENGVPVLGVVRNMERFVCDGCDERHELFLGQSSVDDLGVPVLARLPFSPDLQTAPEPGTAPEAFETLARAVTDRVAAVDRLELPEDPVDIRGLDGQERVDRIREAFVALDAGEPLWVVSDRDPTPIGEFLTDLLGTDDGPQSALPEFTVERRGLDEWALKTVRP